MQKSNISTYISKIGLYSFAVNNHVWVQSLEIILLFTMAKHILYERNQQNQI